MGHRSDSLARAVAAYAARRLTGLPGREIASAIRYRNVSSVSVACRRVAAAMRDPSFAEIVTSIPDAVNANH